MTVVRTSVTASELQVPVGHSVGGGLAAGLGAEHSTRYLVKESFASESVNFCNAVSSAVCSMVVDGEVLGIYAFFLCDLGLIT